MTIFRREKEPSFPPFDDGVPYNYMKSRDISTLEVETGSHMSATTATCHRESVLLILLWPDFLVVFEGYAGWAEHRRRCQAARKWSLGVDILRTCCLHQFSEILTST